MNVKKLERFSLVIYLEYVFVITILKYIINIYNIYLYFICCLIFTFISIKAVDKLRGACNKYKK